jgi:threonine dehydrogenase-like Zn-dependent dehydrogenase
MGCAARHGEAQLKALQLREPRTFDVIDVDYPRLDPGHAGQLIVRARFISFCGSDTPFFSGKKPDLRYPLLPGAHVHECVGTVVESSSADFAPGDSVAAIPDNDAGLAEYFLSDDSRAVRLPASLDPCGESTLIQPLSTVLFAVEQLGNLQGRSVAVVGLGAIGLMFCRLLRQGGAERVIGIDPLAYRCAVGKEHGTTQTFPMSAAELVLASKQGLDNWIPPDLCIEAVGHQRQTMNDCIQLVRPRGEILAFGVPDHPGYTIDFECFFRKNAVLRAAVTPPWATYLAKARDLFLAQREEFAALVTHRFPIQDTAQAFQLYEQRRDGILKALLCAPFAC